MPGIQGGNYSNTEGAHNSDLCPQNLIGLSDLINLLHFCLDQQTTQKYHKRATGKNIFKILSCTEHEKSESQWASGLGIYAISIKKMVPQMLKSPKLLYL